MSNETYFYPAPTKCDMCDTPLGKIMYDAKIRGIFGCVCPSCFHFEGGQLGLGKGQKYEKNEKGFLLVEGN